MLQHGYIDPPEKIGGAQMIAVTPEGHIEVEVVEEPATTEDVYVASWNFTLAAGDWDDLVIQMPSDKLYQAIIMVRANVPVQVELLEGYGEWEWDPVASTNVDVIALDRSAVSDTGIVITTSPTNVTPGTVLFEDLAPNDGCVLGGGAAGALAPRWALAHSEDYALVFTDWSGIGGVLNFTAVFYEQSA